LATLSLVWTGLKVVIENATRERTVNVQIKWQYARLSGECTEESSRGRCTVPWRCSACVWRHHCQPPYQSA